MVYLHARTDREGVLTEALGVAMASSGNDLAAPRAGCFVLPGTGSGPAARMAATMDSPWTAPEVTRTLRNLPRLVSRWRARWSR